MVLRVIVLICLAQVLLLELKKPIYTRFIDIRQ